MLAASASFAGSNHVNTHTILNFILGLTALAGSLVASTAVAGSLDVSGTAKVKYQSKGSEQVTGNPWSDATTITFSGSGDLDNGMTINYGYIMANAIFSSSKLALDMGDTGVLSFGNVSHQAGISKYSDKMPTAGEQVWDDVDAADEDDDGCPRQATEDR